MKSHAQVLRSFAGRLSLLLMIRAALRWTTVWFFIWGVVVLASRISAALENKWLLAGALGFIPIGLLAVLREQRRRAAFADVRAAYDRFNRCGGVVMAEEAADMSAWQSSLPAPASPGLRWRGGRSLGLLAVSLVFVGVALYLPDRFTAITSRHPLEIGKLVGELRAEVETLKQEKILEPKKADDLQQQLAELKEKSSALDPNKTWEALDHLKEANSDLARQAAEEALNKTTSLAEAQTLASALQAAAESGLGRDTATRAAQDLSAMLKAARLEDGLVKGDLSPELLSQLDGLSKADLQKLLSAIQFNKNNLGRTITNLASLRLIDPKTLSQCKNAGQCGNTNALAAYLCSCTNQCESLSALAIACYRVGIKPGGPGAPMTWKEQSTDDGAKFTEQALPPSSRLSDAQFVGVSRAAPDLSADTTVAEHGALAGAPGSGGSANSQVILPRHKQAVQNFFKTGE
jgi:hypothetical protein